MKRFYRSVETAALEEGFAISLDGRPLHTKARRLLRLPSRALAEEVAREWRDQGEEVEPLSMPVTRLANSLIDLMPERRADAQEEVLGYAAFELLCYRVDDPADLVLRQARTWQPWLDWAHRELGAHLIATDVLSHVEQPGSALAALERQVMALDDLRLIGLHASVKLTSSIVLGLALERGVLTAQEAFDLSFIEELYTIERWGLVEAQARRHELFKRDLSAAERFMHLADEPPS